MTEVVWYGWHTLGGTPALGLNVAGTALRVREGASFDRLVDGLAILQAFCQAVSEPPDLRAELESLRGLLASGPTDPILWQKALSAEALRDLVFSRDLRRQLDRLQDSFRAASEEQESRDERIRALEAEVARLRDGILRHKSVRVGMAYQADHVLWGLLK